MRRRTTIELDEALLRRAKRALGSKTTRATVEQALRLAAEGSEADLADRRERQLAYFRTLADHADLRVLSSDDMWR